MKSNNKNVYLIGLIAASIVVYWRWFFDLSVLTSGDWGFLHLETLKEYLNMPFIWSNNSFGETYLTISQYPYRFIWGLLSHFISFSLAERVLFLWPSLLFSVVSSYILVKKINKSEIAAFVGAIVYSFGTYFLIGRNGSLTLQVAFALSPLVIYFFIRMLEEKKNYLVIITTLLSFSITAYEFRVFYILSFVLLFYFLYYSFFIDKVSVKNILANFKFTTLPVFLLFLLNFYWIFGLFKTGSIVSNEIFNRDLFGNDFMNILRSITLFHPFWTGTRVESFIVQSIPSYFWLVPIFAFVGLFLNRKNKSILFFGFISLLGIFLSKQVAEPFGGVYEWLFENFPGFNAFREASKFYFLIALGYSVLIGAFVAWLWENWNKQKWKIYTKYFLTLLVSIIFLWNTKPIITGEIGTMVIPRKIPNDYLILKNFISNQNNYARTLWIPRDSRWSFYAKNYPKISNVGIIGYEWKNFVNLSENEERLPLQERILDVYTKNFSDKLFDTSSIKYIIVPIQDIANDDDFFVNYGGRDNPKIRDWYVSELNKVDWMKKIDIGTKELVVYENENYRSHIYATKEKETIYREVPYEKVEFEQKNPTQYKISLKNVSLPVYLNFSENFHPDWKLRAGDFSWLRAIIEKSYFLPDDFHIKNNANLNSFKIDPEFIKQNYSDSYSENPDGSINLDLTLYFKPQSYFYLGLIISSATLAICLGYLAYHFARRNKKVFKGGEKIKK